MNAKMNQNLLQIMRTSLVIPVIAIDDIDHAVPLARALVAGGIRVLEVTLRTAHGLAAIRAIAEQVPDAIVGGVVAAIVDAARSGNESGDGLVWTSPVNNVMHNRTGTPLEELNVEA